MKTLIFAALILGSTLTARAEDYQDWQLKREQLEYYQNQNELAEAQLKQAQDAQRRADTVLMLDGKTLCPRYMTQEEAKECISKILNKN